jgi:DNA-binding NtrC family response regulator
MSLIVISGMKPIETAVRCMKLWRYVYYVKRMKRIACFGCAPAVRMSSFSVENQELTGVPRLKTRHPGAFEHICGISKGCGRSAICGIDSPELPAVLITGESGAGKELIARAFQP